MLLLEHPLSIQQCKGDPAHVPVPAEDVVVLGCALSPGEYGGHCRDIILTLQVLLLMHVFLLTTCPFSLFLPFS